MESLELLEGPVIELQPKRRPVPAPRLAAGSTEQPAPAPPGTGAHQAATEGAAPAVSRPNDQPTALIPRWATADLGPRRARRRLGVGWWFALAAALAFFLASIALSTS